MSRFWLRRSRAMEVAMTLEWIADVCGGTFSGSESDQKIEVTGVHTDSREIKKGWLFIPLKAERDGHDFITAAAENGAVATLSEREPDGSLPCIRVADTKAAMHRLAAAYRRSLDLKVVGITGSVGKTSTKEMIASVLAEQYRVLKTEGNYNNEIGLPLTIFRLKKEHEIAVLEMGISDFGEMHRLAGMAYPDLCVITNIGLSHLERLGSRDGILKAKTESFSHIRENGAAILNGDDDKLCAITEADGKPVLFYGIGNDKGDGREVYADQVDAESLKHTCATIHIGEEQFPVCIPAAGAHNVYHALAAACVGKKLGLTAAQIKHGIEHVQSIDGRNRLIEQGDITIIDACYNASPNSMNASIDVLSKAKGRKIAVLGDMGELGPKTKKLHALVGEHIAGTQIDALFCTGTLAAKIIEAAKAAGSGAEIIYESSRETLIEKLLEYKQEGDTILVKASHFMNFNKIVDALIK